MRYIGNSFAIQMVPNGGTIDISPANFSPDFIASGLFASKVLANRKSIIGHKDLADILGVEFNRESITLQPGDDLLVAQVMGGRLPEGTKVLPPGVEIKFFYVRIQIPDRPYSSQFGKDSIYGSIMKAAEKIASAHNGEAKAMQDGHGNFIAQVDAPGLYARLWDD